jgi:putative membrane protein
MAKKQPAPEEKAILRAMDEKSKKSLRLNFILQGFTLLTAIASLVMFFVDDNRGLDTTVFQLMQCVMALVIFNVPLFISRKFKCYIPNFITILLYIFIFMHFILGEIYRAYDHILLYDKFLHTSSGMVFCLLSLSIVWLFNNSEDGKVKLSPFFVVLFTFCFTLTLEYLWEIVEYGCDRLIGLNMQRWQDSIVETLPNGDTVHSVPWGNAIADTMGDMIVNVVGSFVMCVIIYVSMKKKPDWFKGKVIMTEKQFEKIVMKEDAPSSDPEQDEKSDKRE